MKDSRTPVTAENKLAMIASGMSESEFNRLFRVKGEKGGILQEFAELNPDHELTKFVQANGSHFRFIDKLGVEKIVRINGAKVVNKD